MPPRHSHILNVTIWPKAWGWADMQPELTVMPVIPHDLLVLCSDGLTKMLENASIASILSHAHDDPHRACHNLIEQALSSGGRDNVTVIMVAYLPPAFG